MKRRLANRQMYNNISEQAGAENKNILKSTKYDLSAKILFQNIHSK